MFQFGLQHLFTMYLISILRKFEDDRATLDNTVDDILVYVSREFVPANETTDLNQTMLNNLAANHPHIRALAFNGATIDAIKMLRSLVGNAATLKQAKDAVASIDWKTDVPQPPQIRRTSADILNDLKIVTFVVGPETFTGPTQPF